MTADLVFSLVDVVSIITLLGCIGFGLFRRDLVMFTACLGLIALTQSCASPGPGFALYSPMLHPQPIPNEEYSQEWFATYSLNAVAYLESAIKVDLHKVRFFSSLCPYQAPLTDALLFFCSAVVCIHRNVWNDSDCIPL